MMNDLKRSLGKVLMAVFASLLFNQAVLACVCEMPPPPCYEYGRSETVFVGTVSKIDKEQENVADIDNVEIKVDANFKGMNFETAMTSEAEHSCAFHYTEGDKYLFWGRLGKDNSFGTNLCTRTAKYDANSIDMEFLNAVSKSEPFYWIWATVRPDLGSTGIEGARAEVIDNGNRLNATSDPNGNIKIEVSKPGEYMVRVYPPKGFVPSGSLRYDRSLWPAQQAENGGTDDKGMFIEYKVDVRPKSCGWFDLTLMKE
jgi:hypothetical protein